MDDDEHISKLSSRHLHFDEITVDSEELTTNATLVLPVEFRSNVSYLTQLSNEVGPELNTVCSEEPQEAELSNEEPFRYFPGYLRPDKSQASSIGPRFCRDYVIQTREVAKRIGIKMSHHTVLGGINLSIPSRQIFIIYGAKKSGKSTLLKIILGLKDPTFGSVLYNLTHLKRKPSGVVRVRYIPQKGGLYANCTVQENIMFFGRIYNFTARQIHEAYHYVVSTLNLPNISALVRHISENELRRLSFYIAIMENPDIVIADELTANIDPVVKNEIWTHMRRIQRNYGATIILTSSDTTECQGGDLVAYLRYGRIVDVGPPQYLFERYAVNTMDQVFRRVAELRGKAPIIRASSGVFFPSNKLLLRDADETVVWLSQREMDKQFSKVFQCSTSVFMVSYILLVEKLLSMWRNKFAYIFLGLLLPAFSLASFFYGIGQDVTNAAIAMRNFYPAASQMGLYCETLKEINTTFPNVKFSNNETEMAQLLHDGDIRAYVTFFSFSQLNDSLKMESACMNFSYEMASTNVRNSLTIQIKIDSSIRLLRKKMTDIITKVQDYIKSHMDMARLRSLPVDSKFFMQSDYFGVAKEANFMVWSFLVIVIFSTCTLIGVWPIGKQHKHGHYDRLRNIGLQMWHFEMNRCFDLVLVALNATAMVLFTWFLTAQDPFEPFGVLLIYFTIGVLAMTLGIISALVFKHKMFIFVILTAINIFVGILSGVVWPQDALATPLYVIAQILPHTQSVEAVQTYIFRRAPFTDWRVLRGILVPSIWTLTVYSIYLMIVSKQRLYHTKIVS